MTHFGSRKDPACCPDAVGAITKKWNEVTCEKCLAFNKHEWKRHTDMVTCKNCGLVMGSGFAECEVDPTPWCSWCGAKTRDNCNCPPRAEND